MINKVLHSLLSSFHHVFTEQKLSILIYHQVLKEHDFMRPDEPTAEDFKWQMALIAKYFTPMSLSEALAALKTRSLPKNAICVTFDDGYINNLTVAAPILQMFDIPATFYIATSFMSGKNMFNDRIIDLIGDESKISLDLTAVGLSELFFSSRNERANLSRNITSQVKRLSNDDRERIIDKLYSDNSQCDYNRKMMSSKQVKELSDLGFDIGAHTVDHPILKSLTLDKQQQQIFESQKQLELLLGKPVTNFAYPNGRLKTDYTFETAKLVKEAGLLSAVSTNKGVNKASTDVFQLNRFTPWDKSPIKFHLRLLRNQLNL